MKREISILKSVEEQNKVLRAERDQMDEDLRSANSRVAQMQQDVAPLQSKNRELSAQKLALQVRHMIFIRVILHGLCLDSLERYVVSN